MASAHRNCAGNICKRNTASGFGEGREWEDTGKKNGRNKEISEK